MWDNVTTTLRARFGQERKVHRRDDQYIILLRTNIFACLNAIFDGVKPAGYRGDLRCVRFASSDSNGMRTLPKTITERKAYAYGKHHNLSKSLTRLLTPLGRGSRSAYGWNYKNIVVKQTKKQFRRRRYVFQAIL